MLMSATFNLILRRYDRLQNLCASAIYVKKLFPYSKVWLLPHDGNML